MVFSVTHTNCKGPQLGYWQFAVGSSQCTLALANSRLAKAHRSWYLVSPTLIAKGLNWAIGNSRCTLPNSRLAKEHRSWYLVSPTLIGKGLN